MTFLRTLLVAFIVAGILDFLTNRKREKTASLEKFVVKAPMDFALLGTIVMLFTIGILLFAKHENKVIPFWIMIILTIGLIGPSFLLMIAPIKGLWEITINNDNITVIKGFVYKKHWKFSSIAYGKASRGGIKIYVEGKKQKAFFVDGMCEGSSNFIERMEKEGKKIIYPETKEQ